jgi:uncharacterized protein YraI
MYSLRLAALAILSVLVIAALTFPLEAGEARASGNTAYRDGPGTRYEVLGNLVDGEYYEVEECTREARWCLVSDAGEELGWVRGSYLVGSPAKVTASPPDFDFVDPFFGRRRGMFD